MADKDAFQKEEWFDPKYNIDRTSKTIPPSGKSKRDDMEVMSTNQKEIINKKELELRKKKSKKTMRRLGNNPSGILSNASYVSNSLEQIIFEPSELNHLKNMIHNLIQGKITPAEMKRHLLNCRIRMFKDLNDFVNFFILGKINALDNSSILLKKELKEKDELLQQLGERINKIYFNLMEKHIESSTNIEE
jgi:hypothetical protein